MAMLNNQMVYIGDGLLLGSPPHKIWQILQPPCEVAGAHHWRSQSEFDSILVRHSMTVGKLFSRTYEFVKLHPFIFRKPMFSSGSFGDIPPGHQKIWDPALMGHTPLVTSKTAVTIAILWLLTGKEHVTTNRYYISVNVGSIPIDIDGFKAKFETTNW